MKAKDIYTVTVVTEEYDGRATGASVMGSRRDASGAHEDLPRGITALTMRSPVDKDNPDAASMVAAGRALVRMGKRLEKKGLKVIDSAAGRAKAAEAKPLELGDEVIAWWVGGALDGRTVGSPQEVHHYDGLCADNDAEGITRHARV